MTALISGFALLLASASAVAAPAPTEGCAVLDQLYRDARTDFTALKDKGFGGALCTYATHKYQCAWSFSTDRYGEAEAQVDRLARCTAGERGAKQIPAKRHERAFRINPETSVVIRGPDPNAGNWKIQLKVLTSADWE